MIPLKDGYNYNSTNTCTNSVARMNAKLSRSRFHEEDNAYL